MLEQEISWEEEQVRNLEELMMLEGAQMEFGINAAEAPVFISYSAGRGRKRRDPVEVVLVMTKERKMSGRKRRVRNFRQHRDGNDLVSAYVKERLGEMAAEWNDEECLEIVRRVNEDKSRVRELRARLMDEC